MEISDLKSLWKLGAGLLPLMNLVALLDSRTLGFWTLTLWTLRLPTPAPHCYPPNPSFPKQKGSWSLFLRDFLATFIFWHPTFLPYPT